MIYSEDPARAQNCTPWKGTKVTTKSQIPLSDKNRRNIIQTTLPIQQLTTRKQRTKKTPTLLKETTHEYTHTYAFFIQCLFSLLSSHQYEEWQDAYAYRRKCPAISVIPKKTPNTHARVFMTPDDLQVMVSSSRF